MDRGDGRILPHGRPGSRPRRLRRRRWSVLVRSRGMGARGGRGRRGCRRDGRRPAPYRRFTISAWTVVASSDPIRSVTAPARGRPRAGKSARGGEDMAATDEPAPAVRGSRLGAEKRGVTAGPPTRSPKRPPTPTITACPGCGPDSVLGAPRRTPGNASPLIRQGRAGPGPSRAGEAVIVGGCPGSRSHGRHGPSRNAHPMSSGRGAAGIVAGPGRSEGAVPRRHGPFGLLS